jgi:RNA polymerase sigma-70 factor (ECF subfamily)
MLRSRRSRQEDYVGSWLPEPIVSLDSDSDPEQEALIADSVGVALLVVLETLTPAERLAFVLHDMFAVPFEEIAPIVGRTPAATQQLASRGRRASRARRRTPMSTWHASAEVAAPDRGRLSGTQIAVKPRSSVRQSADRSAARAGRDSAAHAVR